MQDFTYHNPTKVIFGKDVISQLGAEAKTYGQKALLVYGQQSIKTNGIYEKVTDSLQDAGIAIVEFPGVKSNPVLSHLNQGIELAKKEQPDFIVAVGGGSVLDEAKAIAAGAKTDGDVWDFFTNNAEINDALPLITVLTVAATGSEMNPTGVVTNEETLQKFEISSPHLYPKVSFLDPSTLYTLSADYTAYSAVDAISHVIEGYFTGDDPYTPIQDRIVEGIILAIMESCETCLQEPENYQARATFMWASTLALNGLPISGIGNFSFPNHMIEHSLSAIYDIAHGAGLSIVIPGWMTYASKQSPEKFAHFASTIFNIHEGSIEQKASQGITALKAWFEKIGSPVTLSQANIPEEDIDPISANAVMLANKWGLETYTQEEISKVLHNCK